MLTTRSRVSKILKIQEHQHNIQHMQNNTVRIRRKLEIYGR